MDYRITKIGVGAWTLRQGDINSKNQLRTVFKSVQTAVNYVGNLSGGKDNKVFVGSTELTPHIIKRMDEITFRDTITRDYTEVKSVKIDGDKTTVTLNDGRVGYTTRHEEDEYNEKIGFLFAYDKARQKNIQHNYVYHNLNPFNLHCPIR